MFRKLRPGRPGHSTVVAYLALFVALGGTSAYAANTVFSADIVDGEVKSVDIGNNEIGSADVKDNSINTFDVHSLLGVDVVDNTLTGADIQEASLGQVPSAADSDKLDGKDSTDFGGLNEGIQFESDFLGVDITGPFVTVASSPTLAPGAYLVVGRAHVTNDPPADGVACRMKTLVPGETFHDVVVQNQLLDYVLPLVAYITLPEAASVIIECGGPTDGSASAKAAVLRLDVAD
jgi:hypothetical protein